MHFPSLKDLNDIIQTSLTAAADEGGLVASLPSSSIQAKVMVMLTWRFKTSYLHLELELCACNKICFPISSWPPRQLRDLEHVTAAQQ